MQPQVSPMQTEQSGDDVTLANDVENHEIHEVQSQEIAVVPERDSFLTEVNSKIFNSDPTTVNQWLDVRDRVIDKKKEELFIAALAEMQPEIPIIGKDKQNSHTLSKYASYEAMMAKVAPILGKHGFSLTHKIDQGDGKITVHSKLAHKTGHSEVSTITLPLDTGAGRNAVQSIGSTVSYGKRYNATLLLNIAVGEEDDDGNGGGASQTFITDDQMMKLDEYVTVCMEKRPNRDIKKELLHYMKVPGLSDIPAAQFEKAHMYLQNVYKGIQTK